MSRTITFGRLLSLAAALAFLASGWYFLAPPLLGGGTSYVFTDGISMLPRFHTGDLVVVRARGSYRVGEVVAYHNHMLGTIVLHRIVAIHGDRYTFKGDNNSFFDTEHPLRGQLVGALWVHVPHAQDYLSTLHSPAAVGVLSGASLLLLVGGAATRRRRRRSSDDRREPPSPRQQPPPRPARDGSSGLLEATAATVAPAAAVAAAAFLVLGIVGYGRPTVGRLTTPVPYTQSGTFSYWGHVRPSVAYPGGGVHSGDPVFLRLVRRLRVGFAYRLASRNRPGVSGTIALTARLSSGSGWSRTIVLSPEHAFSGTTAVATGTLDVGSFPQLLATLQQATTVTDQFTLSLAAAVHVHGLLAGIPLHDAFAPTLGFTLDPEMLQVTNGAAPAAAAYRPSKDGSILQSRLGPATMSVHGMHASIASVRRVALVGCVGSFVLLALAGGVLLVRTRGRDEAGRIRARYGPWIVPVSRLPGDAGGEVLHVADVESLAKLAERYDRPILHELGGGYAVTDGAIRYVYRPPAEADGASAADGGAGPVTARLMMEKLGLSSDETAA